jgi:hypothetical protein
MGLSKEAFVVETILRLMQMKLNEYSGNSPHGIEIHSIGYTYKDGPHQLEFDMHRKTKWQALKTLEKEGYLRHEKHQWYMTDKLWDAMKSIIIRFKIEQKKKEGPTE